MPICTRLSSREHDFLHIDFYDFYNLKKMLYKSR